MRRILPLILLCGAGAAMADTDPRMLELETSYNRVQMEQQAVYQQFQMIQEMRRNELQAQSTLTRPYGAMSAGIVDYDENQRQLRERDERLQRYERDMSQAYARYLRLSDEKRLLLDRMNDAAAAPPSRAAKRSAPAAEED